MLKVWQVVEKLKRLKKIQDEISCNKGCNIQFTSGTTGRPKAPLLSHRSLVNNGIQVADRGMFLEDHQKICFNVPFFHAFGMVQGHMAGIASGSTFVLQSATFNPKHAIDAIVKEKCTVAIGTPTMWVNMLDVQDRVKAPITTLKIGIAGGAYVSPDLKKKMKNELGIDQPYVVYGLTEGAAMIFQTLYGESDDISHDTVGYVQNYIETMVVDEHGLPVPYGKEGELWFRGYNVMMEYWDDPENTNKAINEDGWFKSGDKFVLRADGYGQIIGRFKDMIIRGGENIFPKEIETFLESHPAVLEAHVFGVFDSVYGEEICACILLREGCKATPDEIKLFGKGKIANFKIPRYIKVVDSFPKTTSGKIQKFVLKKEMEDQGFVPKSKH